MGLLLLILIVTLVAAAVASFFIALRVRRQLLKGGNKYAKTISVLTFIGSFLIIFVAVVFIITYNLRFER